MRNCESCGIAIDDTSLVCQHRCQACHETYLDELWAKDLHELEAAGLDLTRAA